MCQRLAELGMALAEATQREALRDLQPRPERRTPTMPGMPPLPHMPGPFDFRDSTLGELFSKIARCVRQTILLEARIAGGAYDRLTPHTGHPPADRPPTPPRPPRTPDDRPRLRPEPLEDDLAADANRAAPEILAGICHDLAETIGASQPPRRPTPPATARPPASAAIPKPRPTHPPDRPPPLRSG